MAKQSASSSPIDAALRDLARAIDALGLRWFLFGAQAAIIYGSTRVTEDIDVTIELGGRTKTTRALMTSLKKKGGFQLRASVSVGDKNADDRFVEQTRVLPVTHPSTQIPIDIVIAGPGLEEHFLARTRQHRRAGTNIPVARPEDLIVMKVLAGRARDIEDVGAVLRAIGPTLDIKEVTDTLTLLEQALGQSDLVPLFTRLHREARLTGSKSSPPKQGSKTKR